MSWSNRKTLQTIGFVLIIIGVILILISLIGSTQVPSHCPASGCPPSNLSNVPLYGFSFSLGLTLVITGIVLLIAARNGKPKQETNNQ